MSSLLGSDSGPTPEPRRGWVAWPRRRGPEPQRPTAGHRLMATKTWPCHPDVARRRGEFTEDSRNDPHQWEGSPAADSWCGGGSENEAVYSFSNPWLVNFSA